MDISLIFQWKLIKILTVYLKTLLEGRVSQNFDLGLFKFVYDTLTNFQIIF